VINNFSLFLLSFIFGNLGLAISSTIIAAIIAKAGAKGTLYPVLSFPILLPLIITSVQLTLFAFDGTSIEDAKFELAIVVSYDVIMLTVSYMLFDFIWKD
jgi:heme exporter protein B